MQSFLPRGVLTALIINGKEYLFALEEIGRIFFSFMRIVWLREVKKRKEARILFVWIGTDT
jgi:hypothetical protein